MFEKTNIRNTTHGISIDEHKKPQVNENLPLVSGSPQINFKDHFGALWNQDESIEGSTRKNTVLFPDDKTLAFVQTTGGNILLIDLIEKQKYVELEEVFKISNVKACMNAYGKFYILANKR